MKPYALLLSSAAHAAVIGAAVFVGRNDRLPDSGEICVPLYFEVVEAADAVSSEEHAEMDGAVAADESESSSSAEDINELNGTFSPGADETFPPELDDGEMSGSNAVPFDEDGVRSVDEATESDVHSADGIGIEEAASEQKNVGVCETSAVVEEEAVMAEAPPTVRKGNGARPESDNLPQAQEERAQIVSDPVALNRVVPAYPRRARRLRHEGRVTVEIAVGTDGAVSQADVIETSGHRELDSAALSAVRTARFAPAAKGGVSVCGRLRLTFEFRLK